MQTSYISEIEAPPINELLGARPTAKFRGKGAVICEICFWILLVVVAGATAFIGIVPTRVFGHDDFFLLDNGWRIACGQRPHLDFFSPWGPVTFLTIGMGLKLAHASANGIGYANAIVALVVGLWGKRLARGRLTPLFQLIFGLYLALLVAAPYPLGVAPVLSSHAMLYNRYGYALLALILLECLQRVAGPKQDSGEMLGGISTGVALAITLFLKASYFGAALPFLALSFIIWRPNVKRTAGLALGFFGVSFTFLAYLRFEVAVVLHALYGAAGARANNMRWSDLTSILSTQIGYFILAIPLFFGESRSARGIRAWLDHHRFAIFGVSVFVADIVLTFSNMQRNAMPLLGAFAIVALGCRWAERQESKAGTRIRLPQYLPALVVSVLLIGHQSVQDAVGVGYGFAERLRPSTENASVRFTEPRVASLILYDGSPEKFSNGSIYTSYVNDGVSLLRKYCSASDRVLTMDMVNPFPYVLGWRPPHGGIAATAFNYTISAKFRPSFDAYFGDATVVMLPKQPAMAPYFIDGFYAIYLPALYQRYRLAAESTRWSLYKRL